MKSGVYQLRCTETGERYIGSSSNLIARKAGHTSKLRVGKHPVARLNELVALHGIDSVVFECLEWCRPYRTLERERHWIATTSPELNTRTDKIGGRTPIGGRERINITLPEGIADALSDAAAKRGWDRSRLLEELSVAYLRKVEKEAAAVGLEIKAGKRK